MKLEAFFEKFELFADAQDAVTKMRGLILRLAMQGRLSEAHKTDVPISELLREVEKDKMRLGLSSSAKATSGNLDFSDDETTDEIPARWNWVRFGNIARHNAGKTLDKGRNRGEPRDYITTSNLYWGYFQLDAVRQMPILDDELERCTAIKGDLLICEGGEAGRAAVWPHDREISFQNHVHRARFFAGINPYFVQRYFEKLNATGEIEKYRKGVGISNMSGKALASIPIPLPPLAEQKRIVAKVDELMALCDRLEAQQQERETRHAALARASLARFADAPTPANLNFLFHPSYAISPADLRKSILTLAVQGKLVPQDSDDYTAENSLTKPRSFPVGVDEPPFEVPCAWSWQKLGAIALIERGGSPRPIKDYVTDDPNGLNWIKIGDTEKGGKYITSTEERIRPEGLSKTRKVYPGDFLLTNSMSFGRPYISKIEGCIHDGWLRIHPSDQIESDYLYHLLSSPYVHGFFSKAAAGAVVQNLNADKVRELVVPIPPLAEQRRIVAKVEQLMALVDTLETQLVASRATAANLLSALVAELTGAPEGRVASPVPVKPIAAPPQPKPRKAPVTPVTPVTQESSISPRTLADLRKAAGLNQAAVAKAMGLNQAYISQMETGKRAMTEAQRGELAEILGVPVEELP